MKYLRSLFPRTTNLPDTKFHTGVKVVDYGYHKDLVMGRLIQSGLIMRQFWGFALTQFVPPKLPIRRALLLGLGAGSNAVLLSEMYPGIVLDAVEIDSDVINIARSHFGLDSLPNLYIHHADAIDFVAKLQDHYDLILVDCFGDLDIPPELEDISFFQTLQSHSTYLLLNRLYFHDYRPRTDKFLQVLRSHFFVLQAHRYTNLAVYLA